MHTAAQHRDGLAVPAPALPRTERLRGTLGALSAAVATLLGIHVH